MSFSKPIFLKSCDCPDNTSTFSICYAGEQVAGLKSLLGAQRMGEKWRIYPASDESRTTLLAAGLYLNGQNVRVYSNNSFASMDKEGKVIPSTRLYIDGIPISFSDDAIKTKIESMGVTLRSKICLEYARNPDTHKLTDWLTGRRFIYINVPSKTLPKNVDVGP